MNAQDAAVSVPRKIYLTVVSGHTLLDGAYAPDQDITMEEDFPPLHYGENVIFCITFFDSEEVPSLFGQNDMFELAGDKDYDHSNSLLLYAGPEAVNVPGDWEDADPMAGKISIRVNTFTETLAESLDGRESLDVRLQVYRTIPANNFRTVLMDVPALIRNTIMTTEGAPVTTTPGYYRNFEVDRLFIGHNADNDAHAELLAQKASVVHTHDAGTILTESGNDLGTVIANTLSIAEGAQNMADTAVSAAANAQSTAETAQSTANTAQTAANDALSAINNVTQTANNAQIRAEEAYTQACAADSKTDAAQSTADMAQTAADNAQRTAEAAQMAAENAQATAENAATATDLTELSERVDTTPHIVEKGESGTRNQHGYMWYRLWSDGWLEQGGYLKGASSDIKLTFFMPFADTSYHISKHNESNSGNQLSSYSAMTWNHTTTTLDIRLVGAAVPITWYACGWSA